MYTCTHFNIKELVSKKTYVTRGNKAWQLFNPYVLITIDALRTRYGKITVNDWSFGGKNESRGLRTPDSAYYSTYSQHTHGNAMDLIFNNVTAESVRHDILNNLNDPVFQHITSIEDNVSWLHFDCRNIDRVFMFPGPITK